MGSTRVADRLAELGIELPSAPAPAASYLPWVRHGDLVFTAGQVARTPEGLVHEGRVGEGLTLEQGQACARQCAVNVLAQLASAADGDLDRVMYIAKLTVFVASDPGFTDQHLVANAASELLVDVLGDAGRHARSAVGVAALPQGSPVEVEAIARLG